MPYVLLFTTFFSNPPGLFSGLWGSMDYWISQPVDVYMVIRQKDDTGETIRWMNVTRYLKNRKDKPSRQIIFAGEKLDAPAVWRVRDLFFSQPAM